MGRRLDLVQSKGQMIKIGWLDNLNQKQKQILGKRAGFYVPEGKLAPAGWGWLVDKSVVLVTVDEAGWQTRLARLMGRRVYNLNWKTNPKDGWEWCKLAAHFHKKENRGRVKKRFKKWVKKIKAKKMDKCYVLGTGPTLGKASRREWSDGYVVVCNTIVRDRKLWNKLKPDVIVAGDAIYHFGFSEFASRFRNDLKKRLKETETVFVYPEVFDVIVKREMAGLEDRLVPVPAGKGERVDVDLTGKFETPNLGNVLGLLLLPVACTLSNQVELWGFDGRAPDDKLFWSNSKKHSYPELMPELTRAHPAFYKHFVPKSNPEKYVKSVHGDELDRVLLQAEDRGFSFRMLHKSYTETLQKRYDGG